MIDYDELKEGASLGAYTLDGWIRQDRAGAFFAVLSDDGERLLAKLAPALEPEAEEQLALWQRSLSLSHRGLLALRDVGRSELPPGGYIYAVFEYPDDVLTSAVEQGPLSDSDTRMVLEAALPALRYLHEQGLVHGAVDSDHVVAVGETIKLIPDALRESDHPEAQAEDVRQLGELLRTLRAPEPLSDALATIVARATAPEAQQRWTLAEIAAFLDPPPPAPAPPAAPPPAAIPERFEAAPLAPVLGPPVTRVPVEDAPAPRGFPRWIFAGLAILLLLILFLNLRRKPDAAPIAHVPAMAPVAVQAGPPRPSPLAPAVPATWRVVAFTYRSLDMAVKKTHEINQRWPDLRATVFRPKNSRGYCLVALGERMNREDALQLQRKARSLGLAHDIYVQNYDE